MSARLPLQKSRIAAFTLIELLTVIAIIAILMGLLFPAISGAKEQARRADAKADLGMIITACQSYRGDYGKFPPVSAALSNSAYSFGDTSEGKCKVTNDNLFDILRSIDRGSNTKNAMNKKQMKYIQTKVAKDTKNPRSGFCDGSAFTSNQGQYMDPWGAQYCIVLDAVENETIDMSQFYSDLTGANNVLRLSAVGFSMGKDNKRGGKGYEGRLRKTSSSEAPDDVVSWQ